MIDRIPSTDTAIYETRHSGMQTRQLCWSDAVASSAVSFFDRVSQLRRRSRSGLMFRFDLMTTDAVSGTEEAELLGCCLLAQSKKTITAGVFNDVFGPAGLLPVAAFLDLVDP